MSVISPEEMYTLMLYRITSVLTKLASSKIKLEKVRALHLLRLPIDH